MTDERIGYKKWWIQAAEVRQRIMGPIEFKGKTYHGIRASSKHCGYSLPFLRSSVSRTLGDNEELTGKHGIRFVRLPRGIDDRHAPLYFDLDSLPRKEGTDGRS